MPKLHPSCYMKGYLFIFISWINMEKVQSYSCVNIGDVGWITLVLGKFRKKVRVIWASGSNLDFKRNLWIQLLWQSNSINDSFYKKITSWCPDLYHNVTRIILFSWSKATLSSSSSILWLRGSLVYTNGCFSATTFSGVSRVVFWLPGNPPGHDFSKIRRCTYWHSSPAT